MCEHSEAARQYAVATRTDTAVSVFLGARFERSFEAEIDPEAVAAEAAQ